MPHNLTGSTFETSLFLSGIAKFKHSEGRSMVTSENRGSDLIPGPLFHTIATQPSSPQKPVHPGNGKGQQEVSMNPLQDLPGWGGPAEFQDF